MKKLNHYIKTAVYNLMHNKAYALFCILGTTLTFIFVIYLVQVAFIMMNNYPPSVHSDRTIRLDRFLTDQGIITAGLSSTDIAPLLEDIKEYEAYSLSNFDGINVSANSHLFFSMVAFVNAGFWDVYHFKFIAGHPFSEDDNNNRKRYAVVTKNFSKSKFHMVNSIGKKVEIRGKDFEIIGVVDDFSLFASPTDASEIWLPIDFNQTMNNQTLDVLFPQKANLNDTKEITIRAVQHCYNKRNIKLNLTNNNLLTLKEKQIQQSGGSMLGFGAGTLVLVLLLIPAVNIITLNMANTNNRAEEIAIRRAFGAGRLSSFFQIMTENMLLVTVGTLISLLLVKPFSTLLQDVFFKDIPMLNGCPLIPGVDSFIILTVIIPLMIVFLFMFGGIPAYLAAKRNIANVLKGGVK
jgi:ABC-type antimicrobial peptide transport system permease subunit